MHDELYSLYVRILKYGARVAQTETRGDTYVVHLEHPMRVFNADFTSEWEWRPHLFAHILRPRCKL